MSYVHYTRAGSGDILAINAPQAQFAVVTQIAPTPTNHCNPLPAQIIAVGKTTPSCYATADQGYPFGAGHRLQSCDRQHHVGSRRTPGQLRGELLPERAAQLAKNIILDIAYVGNHGVKLQGFLNGNQKNPSSASRGRSATGRATSPRP